ncbi:MAG: hypothetical protein GY801_31005 [bacterium]|nr:hypothetical protein [bacterium]
MQEFQRNIAIVIGINEYTQGIPPLRTAVNDATRLAQILKEDHGFEVQLVIDADATGEKLRVLLQERLQQKIGADDRVLFYFAGHGIALDGDDGPEGYIIPQDARAREKTTFLPMSDLHDALVHFECRHFLAILDCCFAGAFRWSSTRALSDVPEVIHKERYDRFIRDPAWQVITSASYDQKALDMLSGDVFGKRSSNQQHSSFALTLFKALNVFGERSDNQQHSPFALALFKALQGTGDVMPAGGGDGVITATRLYLFLRDAVESASEAQGTPQTPGLWPLKKHDKGEYVFLVPGRELKLKPAPPLTKDNNPYRGLESFEKEHASLFFGRQTLIEALAEKVTIGTLTVVLGASGTGKSSLVKAGLVPYLEQSIQERWTILSNTDSSDKCRFMRPEESPIHSLIHLLRTNHMLPDEKEAENALWNESAALAALLNKWTATHSGERLLLIIDQFEEVLTLCQKDKEREHFLNLLAEVLESHPEQLRLVLTLRSDFEPHFSSSVLEPSWQTARFVITPMTQDELREVIEGPASERVLYFEPHSLVEQLINEVVQTPRALPLLSFTLSAMYESYLERRGNNRALTQQDYELLGGVVGALRSRANHIYDSLADDEHRASMQHVVMRMVAFESGELARRRVSLKELEFSSPEENQRITAVVETLIRERLIVADEADDESYVEPAHDELIRGWDRLSGWIREHQEDMLFQRRLTSAVADWQSIAKLKEKRGRLWSDPARSARLKILLQKNASWCNLYESAFAEDSIKQARKNRKRLLIYAVLVTLLAVGALGAALFANNRQKIATEQATISSARRLVAEAESVGRNSGDSESLVLSTLLTLESLLRSPTEDGLRVLHQNLSLMPSYREQVLENISTQGQFSSNGKFLLSVNKQGLKMHTLDSQGAERQANIIPLNGSHSTMEKAISPDGDYFSVFMSQDLPHRLPIWDTKTQKVIAELLHPMPVSGIMFSEDGQHIATFSLWGLIKVWKIEKTSGDIHEVASLMLEKSIVTIAFNKAGTHIAVSGRDFDADISEVYVWDWQKRTEDVSSVKLKAYTPFVSFSPDNRYIALADGEDDVVYFWEWQLSAQGMTELRRLSSSGPVAFHPSKQLVTSFSGPTARVWSLPDFKELWRAAHPAGGGITAASYSSDGSHLLTFYGNENTDAFSLYAWDLQHRSQGGFVPANWGTTTAAFSDTAIAFSVHNRFIAIANSQHLWVWEHGRYERALAGPIKHVDSDKQGIVRVNFHPSSDYLAVSGKNALAVWNWREDLQKVMEIEYDDPIVSQTFNQRGDLLAMASGNTATVWTWQSKTSKENFLSLPHPDLVASVAFKGDSDQLLTVAADNLVRLWDVDAGQVISSFPIESRLSEPQTDYYDLRQVAFSPDGRYLIAPTLYVHDTRIWDVEREKVLTTLQTKGEFSELELGIYTPTFSADGKYLSTKTHNVIAQIWDVASGKEVTRLNRSSAIWALALSSDGKTIAISEGERLGTEVLRWSTRDLMKEACARLIRRELSGSELASYISEANPELYRDTCSESRISSYQE